MNTSHQPSTSTEWICPICGRFFKKKNQTHSCILYSIEDHHLKKAKPSTVELFHAFLGIFPTFGTHKVESLKNIIAIKRNSQFCSIQVQVNALKIIFRTYSHFTNSRFTNMSQQSDLRYYYQLKLEKIADINQDLILWLNNAYDDN